MNKTIFKEKQSNNKLKISLFVLFIVIVASIFVIFNFEKKYKIQQHLNVQTQLFNSIYNSSYDKYHSIADTVYDTIINKENIINILKESSKLEKQTELREKLYTHLITDYKLLKNRYIKQLHFHLPDNSSFLRMHAPKLYGDDLSSVRESVVYVNDSHKPIDGFEEGKLSNGFRFVYPMFDANKYIGSVEISFSALSILTKIMQDYDVFANLLIRKNVVDRAFPNGEQDFYISSPLNNFYFEKQIISQLGSKFNPNKNAQEMQTKIGPRLKGGELFSVYNKYQDRVITFIPIRHTLTDELLAYIILNSYSDYIANKISSSKILIASNILLFALILTFIYREIISKNRLKTSEEKTRTILNATDSIIILSDGSDIIEVNSSFFKFFSQHKTIESFNHRYKNFCQVFKTIEDKNFISCATTKQDNWFENLCDNNKQTFKTVIQKDDGLHYFLFNIKATFVNDKKMFLIELTNISNEVLLTEKIKIKDIQLFQKHKMAQMGEMINNIAHQWRQPLAIINTIIAIMKEKSLHNKLDNKELLKKLKSIEDNTQYMSDTIEDFLNFHKPLKSKEFFSINEAIESTLNIILPSLEANRIELIKECQTPLSTLGYKQEFTQILLVIISNAKDALLSNNTKNQFIKIKLSRIEKNIELSIEDNGGGIDKNIFPKIFEPYYSTKSLTQGSGLGLYIVKMIIQNSMDGSVEAQNTQDGAKFIIRLSDES